MVRIELNHREIKMSRQSDKDIKYLFTLCVCSLKTNLPHGTEKYFLSAPRGREAHLNATERCAEMLAESLVSDRANILKWPRRRCGKTLAEQILAVKTVTAPICDAESKQ